MKFYFKLFKLIAAIQWGKLMQFFGYEGPVMMPNLVLNPLLGIQRNSRCFCDSGKKYKVCCLPKQPTRSFKSKKRNRRPHASVA